MKDRDDKQLPEALKPKPRVVRYGFPCGGEPCRTFKIYENEPTLPKLPAHSKRKP